MLLDNLAFRTARSQVHNLRGEYDELMVRRRDATDPLDCEAFLQLGIDAFAWLTRADESIREAIFAGGMEHDPAVEEALKR